MLRAPFDISPRSPCSLRFFGARSFLPIFTASFSSLIAPCSFFLFFLFLPDDFSCSLLHFPIFCCSLPPSLYFCAPCSQIMFSLLPAPSLILGHAPCSLGSQGPFPCCLITPNGGSLCLCLSSSMEQRMTIIPMNLSLCLLSLVLCR